MHDSAERRLGRPSAALALCLAWIGTVAAQPAEPPSARDATRIGRSAVPKAPEFEALYAIEAGARPLSDATFPFEARAHRAHLTMLAETGIVARVDAATILRGLDAVDAQAERDAALRTYLPYEAALIRAVGPVAGRLHTGRSRNDLANAVNRMFYREQIDRIVEALLAFRAALLAKADAHRETVMVVYTHRKEAQPVTLAHYLAAISESLGKHIERYEQLYARMNRNPLGAAASAGTGWPLDRTRTAALLGFDGLVVNTIESVAGWDHIAELAFDDTLLLSLLGRLASEIQLWTSDEYRAAELDPAFAGTSSIMPQKRNPDSLERTRRISAESVGPLAAILTSLNAIEYQHSVVRVALEPRAIDGLVAAVHAMTGVIRTLRPNEDRMRQLAARNFSTMTDLADALVRESGLDFREAHEVVARVVEAALAQGRTAEDIDAAMVEAAARLQLGRPLALSAQTIRDALDPAAGVARRSGIGGPAPAAVARAIAADRAQLAGQAARLSERRGRRAAATAALDAALAALLER